MSKNYEKVRDTPGVLVAHIPHSKVLGVQVVEIQSGHARFRVPYAPELVGNPETGVVAGGVITTLLDQVCGASVQLALDEFSPMATLDLRIDYMKPATPGRDLVAQAHCYKTTRNIAFTRGVAYHDDPNDPIAACVGTFMLGANRAQPAIMAAFRKE